MSGNDLVTLGAAFLLFVGIVCVLLYCCIEAIVNSPEWKTFLVGLKRDVTRQKMAENNARAAKDMETAAKQAAVRFRRFADDMRRSDQKARGR